MDIVSKLSQKIIGYEYEKYILSKQNYEVLSEEDRQRVRSQLLYVTSAIEIAKSKRLRRNKRRSLNLSGLNLDLELMMNDLQGAKDNNGSTTDIKQIENSIEYIKLDIEHLIEKMKRL